MSEYQYIAFRAVDAAVAADDLDFMRRQSSRARITPWSFDNEYTFGDFHGNAMEMLRRGYDFHVHYADFGIRKIALRLPQGLPDPRAAAPYLAKGTLGYQKDGHGPGAILSIQPYLEPGASDDPDDLNALIEALVPLRGEVLGGDLRPLYLGHLAVSCDGEHDPEETVEAPVPAGLNQLTAAQRVLAEFYGLDEALLEAAAQASPALAPRDGGVGLVPWLAQQPAAAKDEWLARLLQESTPSLRREVLARYTKDSGQAAWPSTNARRTITQLQTAAETIRTRQRRAQAAEAAQRQAALRAGMVADPRPHLAEVDRLAAQRSTYSYDKAVQLLAELREALAGTPQADLAARHAEALHARYPTRHFLTSALRRGGFIARQR